MPINGQQAVLDNIVAFGGKFLKTVTATMGEAGEVLHRRVRENSSLSDHSLKDLRRLDHPYAKRHGVHGKRLHDPYWKVHRQSGEMLSALFLKVEDARATGTSVKAEAAVGFDESRAEHAAYVIFGTSKMIPRDPLEGSLGQVEGKINEVIQKRLKNAVVSFKGRGTIGPER